MRIIITLFLLCCFHQSLHAQFQIGDAMVPTGGRAGALKEDDLETFKKTTTIFVVQQGDAARIEDFRKSIGEIWTITPFRVVTADSVRFFRGRKYSLFAFGGFTIERRSSSGMTTTSTHISYDLTIPDYNKKGEVDGRTILARFILSPDMGTVSELSGTRSTFEGRKAREEREANESARLTRSADYSNWGPGQIRGYLKAINDHLAAAKRRGIFDEIIEKSEIKALAKDTLFVPNYVKDKLNPFSRTEKTDEDDEVEEDAARVYPFPHRYINEEDLERLIVHSGRPIYHLIYVRSSSNKYISVVEGRSGKIIYSLFHNLSYNFKTKDLKKLAGYVD